MCDAISSRSPKKGAFRMSFEREIDTLMGFDISDLNWRVTRALSGAPDGRFQKEVFELVQGDGDYHMWVPETEFREATRAWRNGCATPYQVDLLRRAHFE